MLSHLLLEFYHRIHTCSRKNSDTFPLILIKYFFDFRCQVPVSRGGSIHFRDRGHIGRRRSWLACFRSHRSTNVSRAGLL